MPSDPPVPPGQPPEVPDPEAPPPIKEPPAPIPVPRDPPRPPLQASGAVQANRASTSS